MALGSDDPTEALPAPPSPAGEERFLPGTMLADRYRIVNVLGRGGMGEVYRADDVKLEVAVALKLLPESLSRDATRLSLLLHEVRLAREITHPNVCRIHDLGEAAGLFFISMEYVAGENLATLLRRIGRPSVDKAMEIGLGICRGLGAAHGQGILHRDLKPANVLIDDRGRALITDFGLCVRLELPDGLPGAGARWGTPAYMAPEQHAGRQVSIQSDLYALGLVLYELFTGRRPFESAPATHREAQPAAPSSIVAGLDPAVEQIILRCLEKAPGDRPASAEAVAAALERREVVTEGAVLRTLLASDLVGSTRLVERLGDAAAAELFQRHDRLARDLLQDHGGLEIDKTDGFLLLFERPIHAVLFAQAYHRALGELSRTAGVELASRVGIHLGEMVLRPNPPGDVARGAKPIEVEGLAKPTAARLMSLAGGKQTLLTRGAFDVARRSAVGRMIRSQELRWLAHGKYSFQGLEEAVEVFEVGVEGSAPLKAPEGSEKVARLLGEEVVLGWRPAPGLTLPQRPHWAMMRKLGAGGFGEVWLAVHAKTRERRVFKFCFEPAHLRALQREVTLFRLLKEELGERGDIARIFDWSFEEAPFFIESEYTAGGNLAEWAEQRGGISSVPMGERVEIVAQVADALQAAHSVGVLHKDVKPSNVLITRDAEGRVRVRLTDFGVGALTDRRRLAAAGITVLGLTEATQTTPSSYGGTRLYMAPEILEGRAATLQADVYSLGVILYQVVAGDFLRVLAPGWRRDVGDELLREDVAAAVEGSPERRLASARELAERLRSLAERRAEREAERRSQEAAERTRVALERSRRRRRWMATAIAGLLVFGVAMGLMALRVQREAERAGNIARVAVAEAWTEKDPTRAALILMEVEEPDAVPHAASAIRRVLQRPLADLELAGHADAVWHVAWSPDSRRIATASLDGTVQVRHADGSGEPVVLEGHESWVFMAAWSPDGERIATASADRTARAWSVDGSGEPILLEGHGGSVRTVAWSPDGERVVTASSDGTARIWNASGRDPPVVLEGHGGGVLEAWWSPDGGRIAAGSDDGVVRVWTADGSGPSVELRRPEEADRAGAPKRHRLSEFHTRSVAWHPEGDQVAGAYRDGSVWIWNADGSGRPLALEGHRSSVASLAWSPSGDRILTASSDTTARIWLLGDRVREDPGNGTEAPFTPLLGHEKAVLTAFFSPGGDYVLTGSWDGTARIWRLDPGSLVLEGNLGWAAAAAWSPDGSRIVTASEDGAARVWNVSAAGLWLDGQPVVLEGRLASFSPDGRRILTASGNGGATVWPADGSGGSPIRSTVFEVPDANRDVPEERGGPARCHWASFSPGGDRVVITSLEGTVRVWDTDGAREPIVVSGHSRCVWRVSWSPDGKRLASASADGTARSWRADGSGEPTIFEGHQGRVLGVSFSPDGQHLVTASQDRTARVWKADGSGEVVVLEGHGGSVRAASFSPHGDRIVTASFDGTARLWNVDGSGEELILSGHQGWVRDAAWSPDGRRLITGSDDRTARVWRADGAGEPIVLRGHGDGLVDVAWSPDGEYVLTASDDRTARVWRADGSGEPIVLEGHTDELITASFSQSGDRVVTAAADGTVRVWRLATADLVELLRAATRVCLDPAFRRRTLGEEPRAAFERHAECERSHGRIPATVE